MEPFTRQNLLQNKFSDVPKLQDMCIKALMKGLKQSMDVTKLINKNASFETLELILVTLSPDKLYRLEEEKKYLLKNTDTFWKLHCTNKFRSQVQLKKEDESWRIFYQRCCTVSEEKFKNVTASLTASAAKAKPVINRGRRAIALANIAKAFEAGICYNLPMCCVQNTSCGRTRAAFCSLFIVSPMCNGPQMMPLFLIITAKYIQDSKIVLGEVGDIL
ncbi:elongin-A3-like isoform X2 [Argiope bruennichi]|uniref:elongin-A3-like isoform X2 n=1 Tax=Argiope bruennichi TaxID=94029 RepID=UPI002493D715|nr:elongin-A3-like isoform X2 [Argiope bruennichi]